MNKFLFHQSNNDTSNAETVKYCLIDNKNGEDSSGYPTINNPKKESDVLAYKTQKVNGDYKFMIRINADRKLYNPLSIYGHDRSFKLLNNISRSNLEYREVNSQAFDFYLRFLATKNIAWLNKAEREI